MQAIKIMKYNFLFISSSLANSTNLKVGTADPSSSTYLGGVSNPLTYTRSYTSTNFTDSLNMTGEIGSFVFFSGLV